MARNHFAVVAKTPFLDINDNSQSLSLKLTSCSIMRKVKAREPAISFVEREGNAKRKGLLC